MNNLPTNTANVRQRAFILPFPTGSELVQIIKAILEPRLEKTGELRGGPHGKRRLRAGEIGLLRARFQAMGLPRLLETITSNRPLFEVIFLIRMYYNDHGTGLPLNDSRFRKLLDELLNQNNQDAFQLIARELSKKPKRLVNAVSPLQRFLCDNWTVWTWPVKRMPPLFRYDRESLATVCACVLGNPTLTADAVEKTRQRLGLKPAKGKKNRAWAGTGKNEWLEVGIWT